ncbi:MAG TPA: hypothetical protein VJJ20_03210 [Candidatus Paceibacterota bacterium]
MDLLKKTLKWTFIVYVIGWVIQGLGYYLFECSGNGAAGYTCANGGTFASNVVNLDIVYLVATPILFIIFVVWAFVILVFMK